MTSAADGTGSIEIAEIPPSARRLLGDLAVRQISSAALFERLLEHGDRADLSWLFATVSEERVCRWVETVGHRRLSRRSLQFWICVLRLDPAMAPPPSELWPY